MSARPVPAPDPLLVTLTAGQLRSLVAEVVQAAVDDVARPPLPALLDREQIAAQLGCSLPTIDRLRREGMPTVFLGEAPRFELAMCLDWLRQRGRAA